MKLIFLGGICVNPAKLDFFGKYVSNPMKLYFGGICVNPMTIFDAVKDTGELLLQMIENHQKMLEMSRRVENLNNDAKMEEKVETISDKEEDWGDTSSPTPHLLRIGMLRQTIHPSTYQ